MHVQIKIKPCNTISEITYPGEIEPGIKLQESTPRKLAELLIAAYQPSESRTLDQIARWIYKAMQNRNGAPAGLEYSLSDVISYPEQFPFDDLMQGAVYNLLAKSARQETRNALHRELSHPERLKNCGIFDRLQVFPTVSYCAGQDYTAAEIAELRNLIKNGGR